MIAQLAWRYLFSAKRDPFLVIVIRIAFFGISLGVAALIIVLSIMRGFHRELLSSLTQMESHICVMPPIGQDTWEPSKELRSALAKSSEVIRFLPLFATQGGIFSGQSLRGVTIRGLQHQDMLQDPMFMTSQHKNFDKELPPGSAIIGSTLARDMGLCVGGTINVLLPKIHETILGSTPLVVPLHIAGISHTKHYAADANTILLSSSFCAHLFGAPSHQMHKLDIFIKDAENPYPIIKILQSYNIQDSAIQIWFNRYGSFIQTLQVERVVMTIILSLVILIAGFNVISGLMMFVRDKRRDTSLLLLMGCTRSFIVKLYLLTGALIAMGGVTCGITLGTLFCTFIEPIRRFIETIFQVDLFKEEFYMLGQVPADCTLELVSCVAAVSLVICLSALWFPARRAAKSSPLECLRYEQ